MPFAFFGWGAEPRFRHRAPHPKILAVLEFFDLPARGRLIMALNQGDRVRPKGAWAATNFPVRTPCVLLQGVLYLLPRTRRSLDRDVLNSPQGHTGKGLHLRRTRAEWADRQAREAAAAASRIGSPPGERGWEMHPRWSRRHSSPAKDAGAKIPIPHASRGDSHRVNERKGSNPPRRRPAGNHSKPWPSRWSRALVFGKRDSIQPPPCGGW